MIRNKNVAIVLGVVAAWIVGHGMHLSGYSSPSAWCAAITMLCAVWWITEAIPTPATALVPMAAFPLVGILTHKEVAQAYGASLILLMLAGSIVATALEKSQTHRRLALGMVRLVGGQGSKRLTLGFMLASAVLSMWISNTATVVMLVPVVLALTRNGPSPDTAPSADSSTQNLTQPLLFAIAYGAAVGGSATPIGTPPNLLCMDAYSKATGHDISFLEWMKIGLPVVAIMLPCVWLWLSRGLKSNAAIELPKLGPWRPEERRVLMVFILTALAWITRSGPYGGWAGALGISGTVGDSTVALASAALLFVIPNGKGPEGPDLRNRHASQTEQCRKIGRLLDWETAKTIPWGVFIMIGGGMTIGKAFHASNLNQDLGDLLTPIASLPIVAVIFFFVAFATFFTEIASNTAVASILLPIMFTLASTANLDPLLLMVPVTLGLNWAFMLPVGTPPNAIVYGTGEIPLMAMVRTGVFCNVLGTLIITIMYSLLLG